MNLNKRLVIIGGGPAGNAAATLAARKGVDVVVVEREIVGGAAHLLDCVPSKTMIATGGAMSFTERLSGMGLSDRDAEVDVQALTDRVESIKNRLSSDMTSLLQSQGVTIVRGTARLVDRNTVHVDAADGTTQVFEADDI